VATRIRLDLTPPVDDGAYLTVSDLVTLVGQRVPLWLRGTEYQVFIASISGPCEQADGRLHLAAEVEADSAPIPDGAPLLDAGYQLTLFGWRVEDIQPVT